MRGMSGPERKALVGLLMAWSALLDAEDVVKEHGGSHGRLDTLKAAQAALRVAIRETAQVFDTK